MIIGLGTDIININRIEKAIDRFGNKFLLKIYTKGEIQAANQLTNREKIFSYYAKRFAAKEAFVKALGTGFRDNIRFTDIEIVKDKLNKPSFNIINKAQVILEKLSLNNPVQINLSLSDDHPVAIAVVIISSLHQNN